MSDKKWLADIAHELRNIAAALRISKSRLCLSRRDAASLPHSQAQDEEAEDLRSAARGTEWGNDAPPAAPPASTLRAPRAVATAGDGSAATIGHWCELPLPCCTVTRINAHHDGSVLHGNPHQCPS